MENPEVFESEIGTYWFDESGILISKSKKTKRDLRNMKENAALIQRITGGKPACLVVHLTYSPKPDKETLEYVAQVLPSLYKAMAMVSKSRLAGFIMSVLFKFKPAPIPMRVFPNEAEAKDWIKGFL